VKVGGLGQKKKEKKNNRDLGDTFGKSLFLLMSTISASVRLTERNDAETRQLRQSAADALQSYSVLALHSLADNEVSAHHYLQRARIS
jgi:hypothetical protein